MKRIRGVVYTFYSFKGGVGRSMTLANVATLLANDGKKVLIIDWDLEAPGLEKYFQAPPSFIEGSRNEKDGIVDMVYAFVQKRQFDWQQNLLQAYPYSNRPPVSILSAGKDSDEYIKKLQAINWEELFELGFGSYLEKIREEWVSEYDFVLIDSRTGITDIGGICTIHLPDALVLLFTSNDQSVDGVIDVFNRVSLQHVKLPLDRSKILAIPVPSRFENITEYKLANKWKQIFAKKLLFIYKGWMPDNVSANEILEKLFIPSIPYWSFGEGLPVLSEGITDPRSLGFAYNFLAKLLSYKLNWNRTLEGEKYMPIEMSPQRIEEIIYSLLESIPPFEILKIKNLFVRLINVSSNTRVIEKLEDIEYIYGNFVIDVLIDRGLLVKVKDKLTGEPALEIANDDFVLHWKDLQNWIKENYEFFVFRQDINAKARDWRDNGKDKNELLMGGTLSKAQRIFKLRGEEFSFIESQFIESSISNSKKVKIEKIIPYASIVAGLIALIASFSIYIKNERDKIDMNHKYMEDLSMQIMQLQTTNRELKRMQMVNDSLIYKLKAQSK